MELHCPRPVVVTIADTRRNRDPRAPFGWTRKRLPNDGGVTLRMDYISGDQTTRSDGDRPVTLCARWGWNGDGPVPVRIRIGAPNFFFRPDGSQTTNNDLNRLVTEVSFISFRGVL